MWEVTASHQLDRLAIRIFGFPQSKTTRIEWNPVAYYTDDRFNYEEVINGEYGTAYPADCACDPQSYSSQSYVTSPGSYGLPSNESWTFATTFLSTVTGQGIGAHEAIIVTVEGNFTDVCGGHGKYHVNNTAACVCDGTFIKLAMTLTLTPAGDGKIT